MPKTLTRMAAALALTMAAATSQAAIVELVTNGGFETGDLTGWNSIASPTQSNSASAVNPSSGSFSLNMFNQDGGTALLMQQTVGAGLLTSGQEITVSFDLRGTTANSALLFVELLSLGAGPASLDLNGPYFGGADPNAWTNYTFTTNVGADISGGLLIQLNAPCGAVAGCLNDIYIDNFSITADVVPIPAAVWLFGSALLGMGGLSRKLKKAA